MYMFFKTEVAFISILSVSISYIHWMEYKLSPPPPPPQIDVYSWLQPG